MAEKLDSVEFAVHQLEQALSTIAIFGGKSTVLHLVEMHSRILNGWEDADLAQRVARAIEAIMEVVNVDDNGERLNNCIWTDAEKTSAKIEKILPSP